MSTALAMNATHAFTTSPEFEQPSYSWNESLITDMLDQFSDSSVPPSQFGGERSIENTPEVADPFGGYAVDSGTPPTVTLNPAWTLPRRSNLTAQLQSQVLLASPVLGQVPTLSPSNTSHHSISPGTPFSHNHSSLNTNAVVNGTSAAENAYLSFDSSQFLSSPCSAPAYTFNFNDMSVEAPLAESPAIESLCGPVRSKSYNRSTPYSPPPAQSAKAFPEGLTNNNQTYISTSPMPSFQRRRSVSMSAGDLAFGFTPIDELTDMRPTFMRQHSQPAFDTQTHRPDHQRASSEVSPNRPRYPSSLALQAELDMNCTPPPPSSPQKRFSNRRRSTLQSVMADARLPTHNKNQQQQHAVSPKLSSEQLLARTLTTNHALDSLNTLELYLKQMMHTFASQCSIGDDRGSNFITDSHIHLLRDLRCRIKAEAASRQ